MAEFGDAFIAYLTVNPKALGKFRHAVANLSSWGTEYTYRGLPPTAVMHAFALSAVRKTDESGFAMDRVEGLRCPKEGEKPDDWLARANNAAHAEVLMMSSIRFFGWRRFVDC
jgi:hypothetical protein